MTDTFAETTDETVDLPSYPQPRAQACPFAPAAQIRQLADQKPLRRVQWWDGSTPWLVTGPDELRSLLTDVRVSADDRRPGVPQWSATEVHESKRRPTTFLNTDGAEHTRYRRMLARSFSVKNANALRPTIQRHTDDYIDAMLAGPKPIDLVQALALPIPTVTICELLGVPYEDRGFFQHNVAVGVDRNATVEDGHRAMTELFEFMRGFIDREIAHPSGSDTICAEVAEQITAGTITMDTGIFMAAAVLGGGFETTANMIALGTLAFLQNPVQAAIVRDTDDPRAIAGAVDEVLRYCAVAHNSKCRVALADIEIGGETIRAGDGIVQGYPFANWDGQLFSDPERLDVGRESTHHFAFGFGPHSCVAQQLARVELQVVYPTLLRRVPTLRLATTIDQLEFKNDTRAYGVYGLPVTW